MSSVTYGLTVKKGDTALMTDIKPLIVGLRFKCMKCTTVTVFRFTWSDKDLVMNRSLKCKKSECGQELVLSWRKRTNKAFKEMDAVIEVVGDFRTPSRVQDRFVQWTGNLGDERYKFNTSNGGNWEMSVNDYRKMAENEKEKKEEDTEAEQEAAEEEEMKSSDSETSGSDDPDKIDGKAISAKKEDTRDSDEDPAHSDDDDDSDFDDDQEHPIVKNLYVEVTPWIKLNK